MYEWVYCVTKNVKGIHFVCAARADIELHCNYKVDCFASIQTVAYTQSHHHHSHHHFVALNANKVKMLRLSGDDCSTAIKMSPVPEVEAITGSQHSYFHSGQYL